MFSKATLFCFVKDSRKLLLGLGGLETRISVKVNFGKLSTLKLFFVFSGFSLSCLNSYIDLHLMFAFKPKHSSSLKVGWLLITF